MTLDNFKLLIRAYVPGAKNSVIPDSLLELLINKAVKDVNSMGMVYKSEKVFDVKADEGTYDIASEVADDFALMAKEGIWYNTGTVTSTAWIELWPRTKKYMDRFHPNWRDLTADIPHSYFHESGNIEMIPKASTALTGGFILTYIKQPKDMTDGTHYPFSGSTSELTLFAELDDAIISYVRWQLHKPLGKKQGGLITEEEYRRTAREKISLINRRADITNHRDFKMRIPAQRR